MRHRIDLEEIDKRIISYNGSPADKARLIFTKVLYFRNEEIQKSMDSNLNSILVGFEILFYLQDCAGYHHLMMNGSPSKLNFNGIMNGIHIYETYSDYIGKNEIEIFNNTDDLLRKIKTKHRKEKLERILNGY